MDKEYYFLTEDGHEIVCDSLAEAEIMANYYEIDWFKIKSRSAMYYLHKVEKSICPHCGKLVALLADALRPKKPAFYICFPCQRVFQVGVGPVQETKD